RKFRIEALARNLNHSNHRRVAIHDRNRHQLLNRSRCDYIFAGFGLDRLENAGVLYARKIIENLSLLHEGRVLSDRLAGQRDRSRGAKMLGKNEAKQSALKSQKRDFGILHTENFGKNHTQIERRDSLAKNGSQGEKMLWKNDFFHHRVIVILSHR